MTRVLRFGIVFLAALGAFGVEKVAAQTATVTAVNVPSRPVSGDTYGFGEQIRVEITFRLPGHN